MGCPSCGAENPPPPQPRRALPRNWSTGGSPWPAPGSKTRSLAPARAPFDGGILTEARGSRSVLSKRGGNPSLSAARGEARSRSLSGTRAACLRPSRPGASSGRWRNTRSSWSSAWSTACILACSSSGGRLSTSPSEIRRPTARTARSSGGPPAVGSDPNRRSRTAHTMVALPWIRRPAPSTAAQSSRSAAARASSRPAPILGSSSRASRCRSGPSCRPTSIERRVSDSVTRTARPSRDGSSERPDMVR
jgi:hypothetical protein